MLIRRTNNMVCKNCGLEIEGGAGFCPNCGMQAETEAGVSVQVGEIGQIGEISDADAVGKTERRKWSKKRKAVTGIIAATILAVAIVVFILVRFLFLPQVQVVEAFINTMSTASESGINEKYGGYDMAFSMLKGNYDVEFTYNLEDDKYLTECIRRSKTENKFQTYMEFENSEDGKSLIERVSLYADKETSIIGYSDKGESEFAVQIDYADNMEEKLNNSLLSMTGMDKETMHTIAKVYVDLMEALTGTAGKTNTFDGIYIRTKDFFLKLEAEKYGKDTFHVNGKDVKCQVYHIIFDAQDVANYVQDCYNISFSTGEKVDEILKELTGYTMEELFDAIDEKTASMEDLDVYFAVNRKKQLVKIYCENVSKDNINMEINFYGGDYLCDEIEFRYSDDNGKELIITKDDISEGDRLEIVYTCSYKKDRTSSAQEMSLSYAFENDIFYLSCEGKGEKKELSAKITDCKKGKYIEFEDGMAYIGTEIKEINKPEYKNQLNFLDADALSAYSFFSDIFSK